MSEATKDVDKKSPFVSGTGLMGATKSGQRVTPSNAQFLPPGSVVRLDSGDVLIHLHDDLWYLRIGACGWRYDRLEYFIERLPGTLCHHP